MQLHTCKAGTANWLQKFYEITGYKGTFIEGDDLYYAEDDGLKLGVVRISKEHDISVLRGMYILSPYQGKGIGTKLLEYIEPMLCCEPVYCIPKDHLINFYGKVGFRVIEPTDAPGFLVERLNSYIEKNLKVLIMKRDNAS